MLHRANCVRYDSERDCKSIVGTCSGFGFTVFSGEGRDRSTTTAVAELRARAVDAEDNERLRTMDFPEILSWTPTVLVGAA